MIARLDPEHDPEHLRKNNQVMKESGRMEEPNAYILTHVLDGLNKKVYVTNRNK